MSCVGEFGGETEHGDLGRISSCFVLACVGVRRREGGDHKRKCVAVGGKSFVQLSAAPCPGPIHAVARNTQR